MSNTSACHWFFDLEETLIKSWSNPVLANYRRVQDFIARCGIKEIHVFSFAIYDAADQEVFVRELKPFLERALGVRILSWPSVDELLKQTIDLGGPAWTRVEYLNSWGKVRAFADHVRHHCLPGHALLVDDVVPDVATVERRSGHVVECINIHSLDRWVPLSFA